MHINVLNDYEQGLVSATRAQDSEELTFALWGFSLFVFVPTALAWLLWQYRAHANLRSLGAANLRFSPGWAVGWWFIPFANIVMPYLTVRELWKASNPEAGAIEWKARGGAAIVGFWWAGRLVMQALFQIGSLLSSESAFLATTPSSSVFFLAGDLVVVVWAVLALLLVRGVAARQEAKHQRISSWAQSFTATP